MDIQSFVKIEDYLKIKLKLNVSYFGKSFVCTHSCAHILVDTNINLYTIMLYSAQFDKKKAIFNEETM